MWISKKKYQALIEKVDEIKKGQDYLSDLIHRCKRELDIRKTGSNKATRGVKD
jgi:hypothetical protein